MLRIPLNSPLFPFRFIPKPYLSYDATPDQFRARIIEDEEEYWARRVAIWEENVRPYRRRNPREKVYKYRAELPVLPEPSFTAANRFRALGDTPLDDWFVNNIRVPWKVVIEDYRPVFLSRCHREAMAVKMQWG